MVAGATPAVSGAVCEESVPAQAGGHRSNRWLIKSQKRPCSNPRASEPEELPTKS